VIQPGYTQVQWPQAQPPPTMKTNGLGRDLAKSAWSQPIDSSRMRWRMSVMLLHSARSALVLP